MRKYPPTQGHPLTFHHHQVFCFSVTLWLLFLCFQGGVLSARATSVPTVTLAFSTESMPPYYEVSSDHQEIEGLWRKMLDTLFIDQLGWHVHYLIRPWQRAQNEVKIGKADAFVSIITEERMQYALPVSTTFCCFPLHLFTWKGHPKFEQMQKINTVAELATMNLELVSNIGNGWYKKNIEQNGVKTTWLPTDKQALQFVALQRADGLIDLPSSMSNLAATLGLEEKIADTGTSFGNVKVHLLFGKMSPMANRLAEIDAAIKTLQENGTFAAIAAPFDSDNATSISGYSCECTTLGQ